MSRIEVGPTRRARVGDVLERVAEVFGLGTKDLVGRRRARAISRARQVAVGMLAHGWRDFRSEAFSLPQLGRRFGGRDHATILHARRRYETWCAELGLDPVPGDFIGRARLLADHLGFPVAPQEAERRAATAAAAPRATARTEQDAELEASADALEAPVFVAIPEPPETEPEIVMPDLAPDFESEPRPLPPRGLPATIAGDLFGPFDALALNALDEDERRELLLLFAEKLRCERPRLSESAILAKTALAFDLSKQAATLEMAAPTTPRPAAGFADVAASDGLDRISNDAGAADRNFTVFAQVYLTADPAAEFAVAEGYAAFCRFCRSRREVPLPRSNFGASLRRLGAGRAGERITGLKLRPVMAEAAQ